MKTSTEPELLLHPSTLENLQAASSKFKHSFLLSGPPSVGKFTAAKWLASEIVGPKWANQSLIIEPGDKGNISIDKIQEIRSYTQFKSNGPEDRRVVIVRDAHAMSTEAQNSFLKMLEEPSEDVLIILLAWQPNKLLETIRSRVQKIEIKPANFSQVKERYSDIDEATLKKLYLMTGGANALLSDLAYDKEHAYRDDIQKAKTLIGQSPYERLARMNDYLSDTQELDRLLAAAIQVMVAALNVAAEQGKSIKPALNRIDALTQARQSLKKNHNTKLTLTLLFTTL